MQDKDNKHKARAAIAMIDNLVELDGDITAAIHKCFQKGDISFVSIIGLLERHKHRVINESERQDALRKAAEIKAKQAGAPAK